jgi:hypothetical protein
VFQGRVELGDKPMRGAVHVAHPLALTRLPLRAVEEAFWKQLHETTEYLIFEQYPGFVGDPKEKAATDLEPLHNLQKGNSDMRALAKVYVVGLTPGMRKGNFIGGRDFSGRQTVAEAHAWREAYMRECLSAGAVAVSVYNWVGPGNSEPANVERLISGVGHILHGGSAPKNSSPKNSSPKKPRVIKKK